MATRLNLEGLPNNLQEIKRKELLEENGSDVKVSFTLPNGQEETQLFKMGTLVSYLKGYIEAKYGYCASKQVLSINEKQLLNPLCLSDIPAIKESEINLIKVHIDQAYGTRDCLWVAGRVNWFLKA